MMTNCKLAALIGACMFGAFVASSARADSAPFETIRVQGLSRPSAILIDHWGVPYIFPANDSNVFFVQGFNTARDRLFQIDLWWRRGLGQLAEVCGRLVERQGD